MSNFERARNRRPVHAFGDPERWGGSGEVLTVSTRDLPPVPISIGYGPQILRAQAEDLIAIGWDLVATWEITGLTPDDTGMLALEITIGTGQASSTLWWQLTSSVAAGAASRQNAGAQTLGWLPVGAPTIAGNTGVAISAQPIIATAIAARPALVVIRTIGIDHPVSARVIAHCAPRAWVP